MGREGKLKVNERSILFGVWGNFGKESDEVGRRKGSGPITLDSKLLLYFRDRQLQVMPPCWVS